MMSLRAAVRHERAAPDRVEREERRRPHLRVVDDQVDADRTRRSAGGLLGTLVVVLLFASVFGVVVFQVFLVQSQSHLDQLDRDIAKQEARAKDLRLQTADLEAPDRIVQDAQSRLGMIAPGDVVYLQPHPGDDANATFDPAKDKAPVTTTPPVTTAGQYGTPQYGTSQYGTGQSGAAGGTAGKTTPTTTATKTTPTTTATKTTPTTTVTKTTPTTTVTKATTPTTTVKVPTTVGGKKP